MKCRLIGPKTRRTAWILLRIQLEAARCRDSQRARSHSGRNLARLKALRKRRGLSLPDVAVLMDRPGTGSHTALVPRSGRPKWTPRPRSSMTEPSLAPWPPSPQTPSTCGRSSCHRGRPPRPDRLQPWLSAVSRKLSAHLPSHLTHQTGRVFLAVQTKGGPVPDGGKMAAPARPARPPLRSKTVNTVTCVAGLATAVIGLLGVLTRAGGAFDMVFILGGLLVGLAGLILRGRSPRT